MKRVNKRERSNSIIFINENVNNSINNDINV